MLFSLRRTFLLLTFVRCFRGARTPTFVDSDLQEMMFLKSLVYYIFDCVQECIVDWCYSSCRPCLSRLL